MEQLLIVEDDIGLNQGLCKALKADARQIISCQDLKTAKEQLLCGGVSLILSLIHISEPTRRTPISYAVFCLKKKKKKTRNTTNKR